MPYKCCVPRCRGNYDNGPKVHVFGFPNHDALRQKWLAKIPRDNFKPSHNSKVCEVHFSKGNIISSISEQDKKTGKIITINLKKPRLKQGSVPSIFPNCPHYLSKNVQVRKSKEEKLKELDELYFLQAIEKSKEEYLIHKKNTCFKNFDEFLKIFNTFLIPNGWFSINSGDKVTLFKLEHIPGPSITWAIVIDRNLKIETYLYGQTMSISTSKLKTPFVSNNLDDLKILLDSIDDSIDTIP